MTELAIPHESLPLKPTQRVQLSASRTRLAYINTVSQLAMHIVSDGHKSAIRNLVTTIAEAERLKQSYGGALPLTVAATYERLTNQYLALMESVLQQYSTRLLAEAERTANASGDVNLLFFLREWLGL